MCDDVFVKIKDVNVWYGKNQALKDVNIDVPSNCIYAFIGPSGCGKTTLLRSVNRLNDLVPDFRLEGEIWMDGLNVYSRNDKRFGFSATKSTSHDGHAEHAAAGQRTPQARQLLHV